MNAEEKGTEGNSCEMSEGDDIEGVRCPALCRATRGGRRTVLPALPRLGLIPRVFRDNR